MNFLEIEIEKTNMAGTGQRYRVLHDGQEIVASTKDPEHDGARALVEIGADLDDTLAVSHAGRVGYTMTGRLGFFAGHRTSEGDATSPRTIPWVPYSGPGGEET